MTIKQAPFPYEPIVDTQVVSMNEQRIKRVIQRFQTACASGIFPGGQLVVRRFGKMVINEACGVARGYHPKERTSPILVTPQTLFPVYSRRTKTCFGHTGSLSSIVFGDHKTGLSVAIVTNGNRGAMDFASLFIPLSHQLRKACL